MFTVRFAYDLTTEIARLRHKHGPTLVTAERAKSIKRRCAGDTFLYIRNHSKRLLDRIRT
jgi:hypothetical protein